MRAPALGRHSGIGFEPAREELVKLLALRIDVSRGIALGGDGWKELHADDSRIGDELPHGLTLSSATHDRGNDRNMGLGSKVERALFEGLQSKVSGSGSLGGREHGDSLPLEIIPNALQRSLGALEVLAVDGVEPERPEAPADRREPEDLLLADRAPAGRKESREDEEVQLAGVIQEDDSRLSCGHSLEMLDDELDPLQPEGSVADESSDPMGVATHSDAKGDGGKQECCGQNDRDEDPTEHQEQGGAQSASGAPSWVRRGTVCHELRQPPSA